MIPNHESMLVCKYVSMQCKYASMHVYASMQVYTYVSMQVYKRTSGSGTKRKTNRKRTSPKRQVYESARWSILALQDFSYPTLKIPQSRDMASPFPDLKLFFVNILFTLLLTIILTLILTLIITILLTLILTILLTLILTIILTLILTIIPNMVPTRFTP